MNIALGVHYLHEVRVPHVVHGDLRCVSVMHLNYMT